MFEIIIQLKFGQITTCTGQPFLANNVTQAQAFCIATACLQVPVLTKAEPYKVANNLLKHSMNKLSLFRPSLLFGAEHSRWSHHSPAMYPFSQYRLRSLTIDRNIDQDVGHLMGLLKDSTHFRLMVDPSYTGNLDSGQSADGADETLNTSPDERGPAAPMTTQLADSTTTTTTTMAPTTTMLPTPTTPIATETTTMKSPNPVVSSPPLMASNVSKAAEFPNFNQMYAQILQSGLANRRQLLFNKPMRYLNRQQSPALPLAEFMQLVGNNLHNKKTNMVHFWQGLANPMRANGGSNGQPPEPGRPLKDDKLAT